MSILALSYGAYLAPPRGTSLAELAGEDFAGNSLAQLESVNPGLPSNAYIGLTGSFHYLILDSVPTGDGGEYAPTVQDALVVGHVSVRALSAALNASYGNTANSVENLLAANPGIPNADADIADSVSLFTSYQPYHDPAFPVLGGSAVPGKAMRLLQRDDGLGPGGHPRLNSVANRATSSQRQRSPRLGTVNIIDPGPPIITEGGGGV